MRAYGFTLLSVLLWSGIANGAQAPIPGAKELFYDPAGDNLSSASREKTPAKEASGKEPAGKTTVKRPSTQAAPSSRRAVRRVSDPGAQKILGLSYWIELEGLKGQPGIQVTNQRIFKSGERIRLHFRSNAEGQIALLQLGSSGNSSFLFPDAEKGLTDTSLVADQDRVLPDASTWFTFDNHPGTERLLAVFAKTKADVDSLSIGPTMDARATEEVLQTAEKQRGSKDLIIETETRKAAEIGTYGVTRSGKPVILEVELKHE
jgi:Domain of unknown function (DUF4384)